MRVKRISSLILISFLSSFIVLSLCGLSNAQIYYISATGDDSFSGTSLSTAWKTIAKANRVLTLGDTVFIRAGTYSIGGAIAVIEPSNSGTSGNPITYAAYQDDVVTLNQNPRWTGAYISGKDYITIDGIVFEGFTNKQIIVEGGADYVQVKNCTFRKGSGGPALRIFRSDYGYFHDNTFEAMIEATMEGDEKDQLQLSDSDYCRIIDNIFVDGGGHGMIQIAENSNYNVIRGNTCYTKGSFIAEKAAADFSIVCQKRSDYNLIENNTLYETAGNLGDGQFEGFKNHNSSYVIVRRNIGYNLDQYGWSNYTSTTWPKTSAKNTIYHNTFYNINITDIGYGAFYFGYIDGGLENKENSVVNNIVHTTGGYGGKYVNVNVSNIHSNQFRNNIFYGCVRAHVRRYGTSMNIAEAESDYPDEFNGHVHNNGVIPDPKMADPANHDFTLQSDSPAIDAGTFLAAIISPDGSGTSFLVDHPEFFYDGYAIPGEVGDTIKTIDRSLPANDKQVATITEVNYSTGVVTVNTPMSWCKNTTRIALDYSGSGPDIGAHEYKVLKTPINVRFTTAP